jgi:hypothetical protein
MNAAKPRQHYFTVEEANRRLPLVRSIVTDIIELYRDMHERRQRLASVRERGGGRIDRAEANLYTEELDEMERELALDGERLDAFTAELEDLGVELKDPYTGLVDFPTVLDGREVFLCWQFGEDEVTHWHEVDAGYDSRQSLLEGSGITDAPDDGPDL